MNHRGMMFYRIFKIFLFSCSALVISIQLIRSIQFIRNKETFDKLTAYDDGIFQSPTTTITTTLKNDTNTSSNSMQPAAVVSLIDDGKKKKKKRKPDSVLDSGDSAADTTAAAASKTKARTTKAQKNDKTTTLKNDDKKKKRRKPDAVVDSGDSAADTAADTAAAPAAAVIVPPVDDDVDSSPAVVAPTKTKARTTTTQKKDMTTTTLKNDTNTSSNSTQPAAAVSLNDDVKASAVNNMSKAVVGSTAAAAVIAPVDDDIVDSPAVVVDADNTDILHWRREIANDGRLAKNLHANYPMSCSPGYMNLSLVHPAHYGLMSMSLKEIDPGHWFLHARIPRQYDKALGHISKIHSCFYHTLEKWWMIAEQYNITRWAAHGGTAMGTYCHSGINPWDDDIDITTSSCEQLKKIYAEAEERNVTKHGDPIHYHPLWRIRFLNDDWMIIKNPCTMLNIDRKWVPNPNPGKCIRNNWFKLKSVDTVDDGKFYGNKNDNFALDIMCMDEGVSIDEKKVMKESGYEDYLKGSEPLQTVPFGPTFMKMMPYDILEKYVHLRYKKRSWCEFPYDKDNGKKHFERLDKPNLQPRSSQLEYAVSKWYTSPQVRSDWLEQVGKISGNELTNQVPNLDDVEIENSIADESECKIGSPGHPLKVLNFNAERGVYWREFADMVRTMEDLQKPDIIILNEMDIGMARSGNIHTARKLAFELGMNYAWGMEFVELTRGTSEEQNETEGMKDSMGLHGNAILSTCKLYDPLIVRDDLDDIYFSNKTHWMNANGYEKRLGGRMALFARTGIESSSSGDRKDLLVVGSVHKLSFPPQKKSMHRDKLWKYFGKGWPPVLENQPYNVTDTLPDGQTAVITAGDFGPKWCKGYGLRNLDLWRESGKGLATFRSNCKNPGGFPGGFRGDHFCGNLALHEADKVFAPCYVDQNGTRLQIADHAIMEIKLQSLQ